MAKYKLGEICEIVSGSTPKTSVEEYWDGDIKWITPAEINDDSYIVNDSDRKITEEAVKKTGLTPFPEGTVILSSRAPIGKVAIAGCEMYCNQGFKNLICTEKISNKYLYWFLKGNTDFLNSLGRGATFKEISKQIVSNIEINVPDEEAQKKAVENLEKISNIIKHRKQELEKLDELIKARFVELFSQGKHKLVKASEVCDFITKGTTPPTGEIIEEYGEGMIPFLKVYNLSFTGELLFDDNPQYIPKETHNGKLARSKVYPNDVLMNIVGPPLGKFTIVTDEYEEWNINQAIAIFRAKERILPRFLLHALMQPTVLEPFIGQAVGIRQQNLSLEQCRNLQFPRKRKIIRSHHF
ncbi:restriction endonuclease subunit S [[Clostridium] aminophilum]|uniref:restriction endonuclease subunit S n=1 Tax=[Clostridium] aminophilum TaxID=1526 RepID=UPI00332AA541